MARAKRKRLPAEFADLLKDGDLAALKAVFEACAIDARGGYTKKTALAFDACPDALARWLVEQGADLSAQDQYGETALHAHAGSRRGRVATLLALGADVHHGEGGRRGTPLHCAAGAYVSEHARLLVAHGARVDALNGEGLTPLEHALRRCSNAQIARMADLADVLLEAGAQRTARMSEFVTRIGTDFEFHRSNFNPDSVDEASAGLDRLYALFEVPPVPRRVMHDGIAPIRPAAQSWQERRRELWAMLVPSSGAAATVQGEVIRIAGKIARELDGNGGINWGEPYRLMAQAWLAHVGSGTPLPNAALKEAGTIVSEVTRKYGDTERMCELSVAWVALNPEPRTLPPPPYDR